MKSRSFGRLLVVYLFLGQRDMESDSMFQKLLFNLASEILAISLISYPKKDAKGSLVLGCPRKLGSMVRIGGLIITPIYPVYK